MKNGTIITETIVTTFAPDGAWQPMLTGENLGEVVGFTQMLKSHGIGYSFEDLINKGFKVATAKITIEVTGDIDDAFIDMKKYLAQSK